MSASEATVPAEHSEGAKPSRTPGLATQVLIGLALGIVAGVVFGEWMAKLQVIGDVFVGLLQMTVLPYIVVSLIVSLGRLSYRDVRLLARKGGVFILLFWLLAIVVVLAMVAGFPSWPSASYFSTSLIEPSQPVDLVELYVPSNPFFSLSNGIVPSIVVVAIALGLALSGVRDKETVLRDFETLSEAIMRIAQFVVRLAPLGVFALVAAASGTLSVAELGRLQVYLLTYIGAALLLSLWVLPGLVAVLTPIPYRRVLGATQDALVTAFATYNLLIVLPLLSERIKEMLSEVELLDGDTESAADLVVPINFNLPNLGKLLALGFIPFAGWFAGTPIGIDQYPQFLVSGLFSFFGEVVVALPFLLDLMHIPADTFQTFLAVDQFAGRFGTLLAGMNTVVLGILTAVAVSGKLKVDWTRLGRHLLISLALAVAVFGGLRLFFEYVVPQEYKEYEALFEISDMVERPPETELVEIESLAPLEPDDTRGRMAQILERGRLRVGYVAGSMPFVYLRQADDLAGMEVDMLHLLAADLGVALDFVAIERGEIAEHLASGRVDIASGGLFATPDRALSFRLSVPYTEASLSVVVRDYRRREFDSWGKISKMEDLDLALVDLPFYIRRAQSALPDARIHVIGSAREFVSAQEGQYDALLYSAEAGSAWTLLHPQYSVVVPKPNVISIPVVFGLPNDTHRLADYVDAWIGTNRSSRKISQLYDHWILGRGATEERVRWSVVRNVLGLGRSGGE